MKLSPVQNGQHLKEENRHSHSPHYVDLSASSTYFCTTNFGSDTSQTTKIHGYTGLLADNSGMLSRGSTQSPWEAQATAMPTAQLHWFYRDQTDKNSRYNRLEAKKWNILRVGKSILLPTPPPASTAESPSNHTHVLQLPICKLFQTGLQTWISWSMWPHMIPPNSTLLTAP